MIICKVCSARNEDNEEFCHSCGKYLPWHGDQVVTVAPEQQPEEEKYIEPYPEKHLSFWQRAAIFLHISSDPSRAEVENTDHTDSDQEESNSRTEVISEPSALARHANQFGGYVRHKANNMLAENFDVYMASQAIKERRQKATSNEVTDASDIGDSSDSYEGVTSGVANTGATDDNADTLKPEEKNALPNESTSEVDTVVLTITPADTDVENQNDSNQAPIDTFVAARKPGDKPPTTKPFVPVTPIAAVGGAVPTVRSKSTALRKPDEILAASKSKKTLTPTPEEKEDTPQPGDIYCLRCNQFNSPLRIFCRRCGYELSSPVGENAAIPYQSLSWWQRHWHPDVRLVRAGERPGRWGKIVSGAGSQGKVWRITGRVVLGALALVLLFSLVGPFAPSMQNWFLNLYHNTENSVNVTYTQVFAMGANATSFNPAHPPAYAVDDADNTWWQSANYPNKSKYPGVGARLTILFAQSETINKIGWLGGVAGTPQDYLSEARPREIRLTFYPSKYHVIEYLKDTQSFQQFSVNPVNTTSIVCTILKVYPSVTGHAVAITEIEFFQRV
ncbi:MAG: hypothetical protein M1374_03185 [Firmicutes bacterium]|nr:hypothetical protein [Bacillota bacterium]